MRKFLKWGGLAALALTLAYTAAEAGGIFQGLPAASTAAGTFPLTGNELIPADTLLTNGQIPQTELLTIGQINQGVVAPTATAVSGAATLNAQKGLVTSESVTTAAGSDYVLTVTNSSVTANSVVFATVANGTNTTEGLGINRVQPSAGSVIIRVRNTNASVALNGTIKIGFNVQ